MFEVSASELRDLPWSVADQHFDGQKHLFAQEPACPLMRWTGSKLAVLRVCSESFIFTLEFVAFYCF